MGDGDIGTFVRLAGVMRGTIVFAISRTSYFPMTAGIDQLHMLPFFTPYVDC